MTDNGGEGFHVHAVFQRQCCEGVAKVMEADTLAAGPLQYGGQPLADSSGISGRVIVQRGGEHPCRVYFGFVVAQYHQNRGREDDAPVGRLSLSLCSPLC